MKKSSLILLTLFVFTIQLIGQNSDFRIEKIEKKLTELSDSISGLNQKVEFSVVNASIQELLRGVAENNQLNISVDPSINTRITNNFTNVTMKDLLVFLCKEYDLDIDIIHNIISIKKYIAPNIPEKKQKDKSIIKFDSISHNLTIDIQGDSLSTFVRKLVHSSGRNIIIAPDVNDKKIFGLIHNTEFYIALKKLAFANKLEVTLDDSTNFYIIDNLLSNKDVNNRATSPTYKKITKTQNKNNYHDNEDLIINLNNDSTFNIEAFNISTVDIIKKATALTRQNFIFFSEPDTKSTLTIDSIGFIELIDVLLNNTNISYVNKVGIFIFGSNQNKEFAETRIFKFKYRTIWEIEETIPPSLTENLQISPFDELNAFIINGNTTQLNQIENYFKDIDQAIPNILIDVIVLQKQKSTSLQTGLSAFLSDSTVKTSGQIFPGADLTLSSSSLNTALDVMNQFNTVNLGRVKSNFYVTLQALDEKGDIKIKSTPKLATLNGHKATLTIGNSEYYLEETQNISGSVNTVVTTTPTYKEVEANMTISIIPMVSGDQSVTLDIEAEFSDFVPATIVGAPPGNTTRKFVSQIRVKNNEVILLGGLEESSNKKSNSGFPLLSRIPILKWIFSNSEKSKSEEKLMILIKPQIVY